MKIAVFGTGMVGRTIAARLAEFGHDVTIGTRDPAATLSRSDGDAMGRPPFREWQGLNPSVKLSTYAGAAARAEMLINATNGNGSLEALHAAGAQNLNGKLLMDISNPLDTSGGMPPALFTSSTDSLGEQIQRAYPDVKVVKTLNTVTASIMAYPQQTAGGDHQVFVSGNDAQAKAAAAEVLKSFGWLHILDLGDITTARGPEMYLPLWLRLWGALGTGMFNIKIVK